MTYNHLPPHPWRPAVVAAAAVSFVALLGAADDLRILNPPAANPETPPASGIQVNSIASNFSLERVAQGSDPLENPSGVIKFFGLLDDGKNTPTEPDENTYLRFPNSLPGPHAGFDYGRHYLFQGHENGGGLAYVTRINLDVQDPSRRITLLTPVNPGTGQTGFSSIDGSTWDPFTRTLLFTEERGVSFSGQTISSPSQGRVIEIDPLSWPPSLRTLECVIGKGGFEGIHPDDDGNLLLAEDAGGIGVSINPNDPTATPKVAKQPNSFMYRFEPNDRHDLGKGGKLFALQVEVDGAPLVFGGITRNTPFNDTYSDAQKDLRTSSETKRMRRSTTWRSAMARRSSPPRTVAIRSTTS